MALHVLNDKLKIRVTESGFMGASNAFGRESGVLVEVPDTLLYFGFHSFAFGESLANRERLEAIHKFYSDLEGKVVYWESLQDRGRRFEEDGIEYVLLNMTDVIAYDDTDKATAKILDDTRAGGFRV